MASTAVDKQLAVAGVYAEALFEIAQQAGAVEDVRRELEELVKLEKSAPEFASFMTSPALDDDVREAALERMLRGKLGDMVLNTLLVMNRHTRNGLLAGLLRAYELLCEQAANQVEALVTSAVELDASQREQVVNTVGQVTGKTPIATYSVDPGILGGLIVQVGDLRYDNSLRRRLDVAKRQLEERSERGFALPANAE